MISKSVLLLLLGLSATAALRFGGGRRRQDLLLQEKVAETFKKWNDYKKIHGKQYGLHEEASKLTNFVKNLQQIESHNEEYNQGTKSFKLELNSMSDLSKEETGYYKGFRYPKIVGFASNTTQFVAPFNVQAPDHVDWREKGLVTPVKNQGRCGSCWAFSATGALEGQHARKTGKLISLSEQNLVDCVYEDHGGCHGGFYDVAYQYVKENGGIDTEESYPYRAVERTCHFDKTHIGAKDTGFVDLPAGDEEKLKIALATQGPISIAIDAGNPSFMQYQGGVYSEPSCGNAMDELDHAVLLVGYGTDKKFGDYWLIKNSWGTEWGEDGYVRMKRGAHNMCGVATAASYPLV